MKPTDFDHPLPFIAFSTMATLGMIALLGWLFASLGWTGPLGLTKGGIA